MFFDALRGGDVPAALQLLEPDPQLARATDAHGKSGLQRAAETNHDALVRALISNP